jgi:HNH endonuclease
MFRCSICRHMKTRESFHKASNKRGHCARCKDCINAAARARYIKLVGHEPPSVALKDRFWAKVTKTGGCWIWIGSNNHGYGTISVDGRQRKATHVSWFLHHGKWPGGWLLHKCDNPPCVNPAHLYVGDRAANTRDMVVRRRFFRRLDDAVVLEIRRRVALGETRTAVALSLGITREHVRDIVKGKKWGWLPAPAPREGEAADG